MKLESPAGFTASSGSIWTAMRSDMETAPADAPYLGRACLCRNAQHRCIPDQLFLTGGNGTLWNPTELPLLPGGGVAPGA